MVNMLVQAIREDERTKELPSLRDMCRMAVWKQRIDWHSHSLPDEVRDMLSHYSVSFSQVRTRPPLSPRPVPKDVQ